jgi:3-(3-hydroxy-phenyl)propionate hydroxylase
MTPKTQMSKIFRDSVLHLANRHAFARPLVNSGRLSVPCTYAGFALFGPDALDGPAGTRPGMTCPDAPLEDGFILDHLGAGFTVMALACAARDVTAHGITARALVIDAPGPALTARYLGDAPRGIYLIRPDQHIVARWADFDESAIAAAIATAIEKVQPC